MEKQYRIAYFCDGHIGSTMPLVKRLVEKGIAVDVYFWAIGGVYQLESIACDYKPTEYGVQLVPVSERGSLNDYIQNPLFSFYCINIPFLFLEFRPLRVLINRITNKLIHKRINKQINSKGYDKLVFVGRYNSKSHFHNLLTNLHGEKYIDLHEVCNHSNKDFSQNTSIIEYIINSKVDIILHSKNSYRDILNYEGIVKDKVHICPFGNFEMYSTIKPDTSIIPSKVDDYILYFGIISHYKGLDILLKAVLSIEDNIKVVIAGKGNDGSLVEMQKDSRFHIINRFLSSEELVALISHCRAVVCPYRTMSQSGIPQTVFVFDKPIIASDLDGFKEIIHDGVNGLLFKSENSEDLACAIQKCYQNDIYDTLVSGVSEIDNLDNKFSWLNITNKHISILNIK